MKIAYLLRVDLAAVDLHAGVGSVRDRLLAEGFLVVVEDGRFRGVLTPDDLVRSPRALVADCLSEKPTVRPEAEIPEVLDLMKRIRTTVLPVTERDKLLGVCVRSDIAEYLDAYGSELEREAARRTEQLRREIERRSDVEEALAKSERQYRLLVEASNEGIVALDREDEVVFVNAGLLTRMGYALPDLTGRSWEALFPEEDRARIRRTMESVRAVGSQRIEVPLLDRAGRPIWFLVSIHPRQDEAGTFAGSLAMLMDIDERRQLELHARKNQELESLGRLAGGIAHDFNNLLTPILGHAQLLLGQLEEDEPAHFDVEQIDRAARRARELVSKILATSHPGPRCRAAVGVAALISEVLDLIRTTLPSNVRVVDRVSPDVGCVLGDPTEVHQVLMNLATNALHSLRDRSEAVLAIEAGRVVLGPETVLVGASETTELAPGVYVRITVSDTGTGMDAETCARLFEPYFSTKKRGDGSGLGLAVVRGLVTGAGGAVGFETALGRGSSFRVWLPSSEQAGLAEPNEDALTVDGRRVLLVDDEPSVVQVGLQLLEALGHVGTGFTSPLLALERFLSTPDDFDLLITDQTMPDLLGTQLAEQVRGVRPGLPVLLITGQPVSVAPGDSGLEVLRKPFTLRDLAAAVSRCLSALDTSSIPYRTELRAKA